MTQEEEVVQEILAARARSLATGEPFPSRSVICRTAVDRNIFQAQWVRAQKVYKDSEAEILASIALQQEVKAAAMVENLTALWIDYRQEGTVHATHPYNQAIAQLGVFLRIRDRNKLIDWIDDRYPNWRGYPAPKASYPPLVRGAA